jgi:hypothetical protein
LEDLGRCLQALRLSPAPSDGEGAGSETLSPSG